MLKSFSLIAAIARAIRSNSTSGLLEITGPAAGTTRVMTVPNANFTAARTDAGQTFTGTQVMTSPRIVTSINDTNGNELVGVTATASAVNEITVANAATGANPVISATGSDTNIGITLTPKGTGNAVLTSGNLVVANGNGIDFSATSHPAGMTSELLDDYEEGTWTATLTASTAGPTTPVTVTSAYTKIGQLVTVTASFLNVDTTGASGDMRVTGLPYTVGSYDYHGTVGENSLGGGVYICTAAAGSTRLDIRDAATTVYTPIVAGTAKYLLVTITYAV